MCFFSKLSQPLSQIEQRFKAKAIDTQKFEPTQYNGFSFPKTPVITNLSQDKIQFFQWGLIPSWSKDEGIKKFTLNARIETLDIKPSFKNIQHQRCLVIADGFYEWKWLDPKGKEKQKYELSLPDQTIFSFAGLWSQWVNPQTGELIQTYTIITTQANALMSEIHNSKQRMPIILNQAYEYDWLMGRNFETDNHRLMARLMS